MKMDQDILRYTDKSWTTETMRWEWRDGKRKVGTPVKRWVDDNAQTVEIDWIEKIKYSTLQ